MHDELRALQKKVAAVFGPVIAFQKIQASSAKAADAAEMLLRKWPDSDTAASLLKEAAEELQQLTGRVKATREDTFRKLEADFIRELKETGKSVKERDSAWKIDFLELEVNRSASQVRVNYNREPVVPWQRVANASDIAKLLGEARHRLEKASIPESTLPRLLLRAYDAVVANRQSRMAPIGEVFREFRIAILSEELRSGKPDKKLQGTEMPRWAFLWNLDRYRELTNLELQFEPGSQQDAAKGLGFTLGGRSASDYKVFCYLKRAAS